MVQSPVASLSWLGFIAWTLIIALTSALLQAAAKDLYAWAKASHKQRQYRIPAKQLDNLCRLTIAWLVFMRTQLAAADRAWVQTVDQADPTDTEGIVMLDATLSIILPICNFFFEWYTGPNDAIYSILVGFEDRDYHPYSTLQEQINELAQLHLHIMTGPFNYDHTRNWIGSNGEMYRIISLTNELIYTGKFGAAEFEYTVQYLGQLSDLLDEMIGTLEELKQMLASEY